MSLRTVQRVERGAPCAKETLQALAAALGLEAGALAAAAPVEEAIVDETDPAAQAEAEAVLALTHRVAPGRFHALATLQLTLDAVMFMAFDRSGDDRARELARALTERFVKLSRHMGIFEPRSLLYAGQAAALTGRSTEALGAWRKGLMLAQRRALDYDAARLNWMLSLYLHEEQAQRHELAATQLFAICGVNFPYPFIPTAPG